MTVIIEPKKFIDYGFIQSTPDFRDYQLMAIMGAENIPTEPEYLSGRLLKIVKQERGNCTGQSSAYLKQLQEAINHPGKNYIFSGEFAYGHAKLIDGKPNTEGTEMRFAMKVLADKGICLAKAFPDEFYKDPNYFTKLQSQEIISEAQRFKIGTYARVNSINEIKLGIKTGCGVKCGVMVTESYVESEEGFIPIPEGYLLGGHDTCIIGWNDNLIHRFKNSKTTKGAFIFVNSWGEEWGDKGYGYIPYELLNWRTDFGMPFFMEAWTSMDVIMPDPKAKKMSLWIDRNKAVVDGEEVFLEQPPTINPGTGRTLVPVRFIAENLGCKVEWNSVERRIDIYND